MAAALSHARRRQVLIAIEAPELVGAPACGSDRDSSCWMRRRRKRCGARSMDDGKTDRLLPAVVNRPTTPSSKVTSRTAICCGWMVIRYLQRSNDGGVT